MWPLRHEPAPGPSAPFDGPYRGLRREAYAAVSPERNLLTGEYADELFADGETWLRDALGQRRFGRALSAAFAAWCHAGYRLRGSGLWSALRATPRRPRPHSLLEAIAESPIHYERHFSNGLEIRRPFRDLRLVQLAAGLAGDRRFRPGQPKPLLRATQRGRLPAEVVERTWRGTLFPLVARGLTREGQRLRPFLTAPVSDLRKRLDLEPLLTRLEARPLRDGKDLALLWRALTYEICTRRRIGLAGFGSASFEEETYAQAA